MNARKKETIVLAGLAIGFVVLSGAFLLNLWGQVTEIPRIPPAAPEFTNTATVRMSAAQLIKSGEDASGLDCYACHDKAKPPPQLHLDDRGNPLLPKEHEDIVMRHGRNGRNQDCFNCHDPKALDTLKTRDGRSLKLTESTLLCASCHGPTYRDWEVGIHGRTSGHWKRDVGEVVRQECASCHHPHSPAFPSMKPAPAPHRLHEESAREHKG